MSVLTCCTGGFRTLSRAAAKAAKARLRGWGWGAVHPRWADRASECERCPLRVIRGHVTYCGQPLLERIERDIGQSGCGCPTRAKAQDPHEHCPLDGRNRPRSSIEGICNCKWCRIERPRSLAAA